MEKLKSDLEAICKAFNLGKLLSFQTNDNLKNIGFNTAIFNTEREINLKYHFKL